MADLTPKTRAKVSVPKAQITYMVKNSKYTYEQIVKMIQAILVDVLAWTKKEMEIWIDSKVAKRTGQLRHMLKLWLGGSSVGEGLMKLTLGTNLDYAEDVNKMTTSQVRHRPPDKGYVYYPNIFGIDSKTRPRGSKTIPLNDPRAIGFFFDKMVEYAKERVDINLIKAKNKHLGNAIKRTKAPSGGFVVSP